MSLTDDARQAWIDAQAARHTEELEWEAAHWARRRQSFHHHLHERLGWAVAEQEMLRMDDELRVVLDELVFAEGTRYSPGDGMLSLVRTCGTCGSGECYGVVDSLTTLGRELGAPAECPDCQERLSAATEALVEAGQHMPSPAEQAITDWRAALADLEHQRAELVDAARLIRVCQAAADTSEAQHVIAGVPGRNEAERRATLVLALHDDPQHQRLVADLRSQQDRRAAAERGAELAREHCRLARALLALHPSPDDSGA